MTTTARMGAPLSTIGIDSPPRDLPGPNSPDCGTGRGKNAVPNRGPRKRPVGWVLGLALSLALCQWGLCQWGLAAEPLGTWQLITPRAPWRPRDSQGEVVFRDRLWILGGWFDSFQAPPRDVWSSPDGVEWRMEVAEAPWKHSDLPMTVVFRNRLWLMGGWYNGRLPGHSASNEVWSSADGVEWRQETPQAGWSPRLAGGLVEFADKLWILGGTENYYFGDDSSLKNDVWCSDNGRDWTRVCEQAPWSPRAYHQAVVLKGRMYVLGGGNYVPKYQAVNDVWSSADGVNWRQETAAAGWSPRLWFSAVPYRERLWVLGGWSNQPSQNWGDCWYSRDGTEWKEWKSERKWKERHEHSAYVFRDRLWIAGGHAQPLSSEVWSLEIPPDELP